MLIYQHGENAGLGLPWVTQCGGGKQKPDGISKWNRNMITNFIIGRKFTSERSAVCIVETFSAS